MGDPLFACVSCFRGSQYRVRDLGFLMRKSKKHRVRNTTTTLLKKRAMAGGLTLMTSLYPPLLGSVFWDRYGPGKRDGKWKTRTEKDAYTVVHHNPDNPIAIIETSMGTTRAEIFLDVMPITASNFIDLANKRFYDGLHVHSVTPNYIVQVRFAETRRRALPHRKTDAHRKQTRVRERAQWERESTVGERVAVG